MKATPRATSSPGNEVFVPGEATAPWADPSRVDQHSKQKKSRHIHWAFPRLQTDTGDSNLILCDISAGPGYYTLEYAASFRYVLHCDLSARALSYAARRASERQLDNVILLRIDYLRPPFRGSLDRVICFDTLIRGPEHDTDLLGAIAQSLRPEGIALVDFHNWWHNPLRKLGLLPDNFVGNTSYTRSGVRALLRDAGISGQMQEYYEELDADAWYTPVLTRILPPTRHTVTLRGGSS